MNIVIESLFSNQNGIEYTWSNNGGDESEIEKMSKDDFALLLCEHSENSYIAKDSEILVVGGNQISEDHFEDLYFDVQPFVELELSLNTDYCKECLVKYLQSQNKN
jgi:hypothetical protein